MLALGSTVLIPKPGQDKSHLWVIVTAVNPQNGEVIIVNFTTQPAILIMALSPPAG